MTLLRAAAIGLLAGAIGALIFDPRGTGLDHLRLAMLMGLLAGQFLTVPISLVVGAVSAWRTKGKRKPSRPYDFSMGPLLLATGVLVVTQAQAVLNWLDTKPTPGGVGDPDGETSIALMAAFSGSLMALIGLTLLMNGARPAGRPID